MSEFHPIHNHSADEVEGGGGGLPSWFQSGAGSPVGTVTPAQQGALYQDTTNGALYEAVGVTSADWVVLGGYAPNNIVGISWGNLGGASAGTIQVISADTELVTISDAGAQAVNASANGIYWNAVGGDGNQHAQIETGPVGDWVWDFKADGSLQLPNGNSLYNTAASPSNGVGSNGDWSLGADGHIYHKQSGIWVEIV